LASFTAFAISSFALAVGLYKCTVSPALQNNIERVKMDVAITLRMI